MAFRSPIQREKEMNKNENKRCTGLDWLDFGIDKPIKRMTS